MFPLTEDLSKGNYSQLLIYGPEGLVYGTYKMFWVKTLNRLDF